MLNNVRISIAVRRAIFNADQNEADCRSYLGIRYDTELLNKHRLLELNLKFRQPT